MKVVSNQIRRRFFCVLEERKCDSNQKADQYSFDAEMSKRTKKNLQIYRKKGYFRTILRTDIDDKY